MRLYLEEGIDVGSNQRDHRFDHLLRNPHDGSLSVGGRVRLPGRDEMTKIQLRVEIECLRVELDYQRRMNRRLEIRIGGLLRKESIQEKMISLLTKTI